jgi:oligopeptidase B
MENVRRQAYPPLLLQSGLHDSRVGYWEPAKWTQRVRAVNTGPHPVVFKCEMDEGHTGAMDRYKYIKQRAFELAWALDCLGIGV